MTELFLITAPTLWLVGRAPISFGRYAVCCSCLFFNCAVVIEATFLLVTRPLAVFTIRLFCFELITCRASRTFIAVGPSLLKCPDPKDFDPLLLFDPRRFLIRPFNAILISQKAVSRQIDMKSNDCPVLERDPVQIILRCCSISFPFLLYVSACFRSLRKLHHFNSNHALSRSLVAVRRTITKQSACV